MLCVLIAQGDSGFFLTAVFHFQGVKLMSRERTPIIALVFIVGMSSLAQAAPIFYDNEANWLAAMQSVTLEDFNSQTNGTPFHTTPLDVGPFTLSMTGTPSTSFGRNQIDTPPPQFSQFDVDGTTIANVLTRSGDSLFLTFDAAISGFGVNLASFNDDQLRTSILVAGGSTSPVIGPDGFVRFFGVTSDTPFTTVEFRGIDNDGYGMDNVQFGNAVPEPTTLAIAGLGLLGVGCCRRKRT